MSKVTGPDEISARVLKHCAAELSLPLSRLFSLCFQHGTQPYLWKTANVVPIHKKKKVSNSRPKLSPCVPAERPLQSHGESGEQEDHDLLGKGESFV